MTERGFDASPFAGCRAACFTGHRPGGLPETGTEEAATLETLLHQAVRAAADSGVVLFRCGGARGFDLMAAEAVLALKKTVPELSLCLSLSAPGQAAAWKAADRKRYEAVLEQADGVYYASESVNASSYRRRNRHMADHADCCVAYLKKGAGGTLYTVTYALKTGIPVLNLATGQWLFPEE